VSIHKYIFAGEQEAPHRVFGLSDEDKSVDIATLNEARRRAAASNRPVHVYRLAYVVNPVISTEIETYE